MRAQTNSNPFNSPLFLTPSQAYQKRVQELTAEQKILNRIALRLTWLRLLFIVAAPVSFFTLMGLSQSLAFVAATISVAAFIMVVVRHVKVQDEAYRTQRLIDLNQFELEGKPSLFSDGTEYQSANHPYTSDLDIFGAASIYAMVNRCTTLPGGKLLSDWLSNPASADDISLRQDAVKELSTQLQFRQSIQTAGSHKDDNHVQFHKVSELIAKQNLHYPKWLPAAVTMLSALAITALVASMVLVNSVPLLVAVIVNIVFYYNWKQHIEEGHKTVSKIAEGLNHLSTLSSHIQGQTFSAPLLVNLQNSLSNGDSSASKGIKKLSIIASRFDYRLNIYIGLPLNIFLLWDIRQLVALSNWAKTNNTNLKQWVSAIAQFESLSSLATLAFNNPSWCYPTQCSSNFELQAQDMGHPLIPSQNRICNNMQLSGNGKVMLITGSNMAGKSTFLRTIGVNLVLAQCGAPVCAQRLVHSPVTPYTSMRIADSLGENTSTFYAELKRLRAVLEAVKEKKPIIALLDEVLRGTNSSDRHKGAKAIINQIIKHNSVGVIASHDLELANPEQIAAKTIDAYYFDVKINADELYFDYTLTPGVNPSLNAAVLMKKMGIELEE